MDIDELSDEVAVRALASVGKRWLAERGVEAYVCMSRAVSADEASMNALPEWAIGTPEITTTSSELSRRMLAALRQGSDDEVAVWTEDSIREASAPGGHVLDPLTLAIAGAILIGAILASRVKRIGAVEFYEGIPDELGNVIKKGAAAIVPSG